MARTYVYNGLPVEIDDFAVSFKSLRSDIYRYVNNGFPQLGEMTYSDYEDVWNSAYSKVVDLVVKYFEENNIIDFTNEVVDNEIDNICNSGFRRYKSYIKGDVSAKSAELAERRNNNNNNVDYSNMSAGQMLLGAAIVGAVHYGINENNWSKAFSKYKDEIIEEFTANKQRISVYITKIMASKMIDEKYVASLDEKTSELLEKMEDYEGDLDEKYDELIAQILSTNSIDWYVYETIFQENQEDLCINPFDIDKIARFNNFDISDLIIDYFTYGIDNKRDDGSAFSIEDMIEEASSYTPEESGDYAEFLDNLVGLLTDFNGINVLMQTIEQASGFDDLIEISKALREISISVKTSIVCDSALNQKLSDELDRVCDSLKQAQAVFIEMFHISIVNSIVNDTDSETTLEREIYIADTIGNFPDRSDEQIELYTGYRESVCERALNEWTEIVKGSDRDTLVVLRDDYYNGNEKFFTMAHDYISKTDYENLLITQINDIENKQLFKMTMGMSEKSVEELNNLREDIIALNYSEKATSSAINKIDNELYNKLHDKTIAEIKAKVKEMSYETTIDEFAAGQKGRFSIYQPDRYVSKDDINGILLDKIKLYETSQLENMCSDVNNADITSAEELLARVKSLNYREENKSTFYKKIENRITACQEEIMNKLCGGMESMTFDQLLSVAQELDVLPYDHLTLKSTLTAKLNQNIRKEISKSMLQNVASLDRAGFKTISDRSKNYIEFEKTVTEKMGVSHVISLKDVTGNNMLGSREIVLGEFEAERMLGLAENLKIMVTNRQIFVVGNQLIPYNNIASIKETKKLFTRKIDITLRNGFVVSFGCPKDVITQVCDALNSVRSIFS